MGGRGFAVEVSEDTFVDFSCVSEMAEVERSLRSLRYIQYQLYRYVPHVTNASRLPIALPDWTLQDSDILTTTSKMEVWEKSETVDPEVRAYVYSLVNAVGGQSTLDDRYALGDDALAVLNDLLRWLRLYDEKTNRFDVKRCLAEANLVKGDLLEILALWPEDAQENKLKSKLALACLQLLVPLTWPIELEEEKTTVNHLRHTPYLQLAQVGYKRAVVHYEDARILRTAVRIGLPSMAQERRERSKRDEGIIRLMLYFFRNVAMITQPQNLPSQGDENEISRSSTIEAFHEQDVFNLLLTVGSGAGDEFQDQDVIILETVFHLLKGVDPKKLFMQKEQLANEETNELHNLMLKEKAMLSSYNKNAPTRHNRFGTMIWVRRDDEKLSTVTGQNSIVNESSTLHQMDSSKKWNKPKYRGKTVHEFSETSDFGTRIDLTESARKHLRQFVEDFLDSSFNPLFSSLRKAIERENDRVGNLHHRQFFYLISWFLDAEAARREHTRRQSASHASLPPPDDNTFAYIAAVLDQETFVLLNRAMQRSLDEKNWPDLHSTLLCFTQILLTVQSMADSNDDEDQDIAENIQSRIFYEEATQDRIVQILRGYRGQGVGYLDAVTECVGVFVRVLERFSRVKGGLLVRLKRRARTKKKRIQKQKEQLSGEEGQEGNNDDADDDDDASAEDAAEEEREAHRAVSERKFDFARFSAKFLTQPCVNTFVALLHLYADLSPTQLKRCHRYLYRLAFKHELAVMLFRVDILQLLHKMIKGPNGLDAGTEGFKEWEVLVQQVFRRCTKFIERQTEGEGWREAAVVEMLFSKVPGTVFYLQNGFEVVVERRAPRPPAELEVKASVVEVGRRVGVAVSVLVELGRGEAVEWVKREIRGAVEERRAWEEERAARAGVESQVEGGEMPVEDTGAAVASAPTIFVGPDSEERKAALFKDKYLRLLLTTLGLQRLGTAEDVDASWIIPSELSAAQLKETLEQIQKAEFDGLSLEEGKSAQDLIRNKSAASSRREVNTFSDSESSDDGDEAAMFPPNRREKRKNQDGDEEEQPKKKRRLTRRNRTKLTDEETKKKAEERQRTERERNSKIKSQLFVTESDDESDEERDAEFFRLEEERRRRVRGVIRGAIRREKAALVDGGIGKVRRDHMDGGEVEDAEALGIEMYVDDEERDSDAVDAGSSPGELGMGMGMGMVVGSEQPDESSNDDSQIEGDDAEEEGEDEDEEATPSTSPTGLDNAVGDALPLRELSANAVGFGTSVLEKGTVDVRVNDEKGEEGEDEDDAPVVKSAVQRRRNVRAGFIIDDDSE